MIVFEVTLELTEGFTLDVDRLNVGQLGYLSKTIDAPILSFNASRGKNRELDKYGTGTASITFDNSSGIFNPTDGNSPLYGSIYPGRKIVVTFLDTEYGSKNTIYSGYTGQWSYNFEINGLNTATVDCVDAFAQLSNYPIVNLVCPEETTGDRITRILTSAQVNFSTSQMDIDKGITVCAAGTFSGTALELMQQCELTEQGSLFINRWGKVRFVQRNSALPQLFQFKDASLVAPRDGIVGYTAYNVEYSVDTLANAVTVVSPVGTAISSNASAISTYQLQSKDFQTLHKNTTELQSFANFIVDEYGSPEYRVANVRTSVNAVLGQNNAYSITTSDLSYMGDATVLLSKYNAYGTRQKIIGIKHIATPGRYDVEFALEKAVGILAFRLNDSYYGVLDSNELAF